MLTEPANESKNDILSGAHKILELNFGTNSVEIGRLVKRCRFSDLT